MNLAEQTSLVQRLLAEPYDQKTLFSIYDEIGKDPPAYAALLVRAADVTTEHVAASHWLTEAARVNFQALADEKSGIRLLEAALERDPLNFRAAEHLVELYRSRREDDELGQLLRARAERLRQRYSSEPVELPKAAAAFEKLCGVYEALGDTEAALASLRTALEFERARNRNTAPSPPPGGPPESWFRSRAESAQGAAPPPEPRWTANPDRDSRDTMPSPIPAAVKDGAPVSSPNHPRPARPAPSDPLLSVIEALHALRKAENVVDGAALVLRTALEAIPSVAGFVHVCDMATRDFVIIASSGAHNAEVIGIRTLDTDPVIVRALEEMQAVALDASEPQWLVGERWQVICPTHAVLCAPVQYDGRQLGAIELVDPTGHLIFTGPDRHAMTYVGERFAEFLAERTITF